jgi:hypothetical protein
VRTNKLALGIWIAACLVVAAGAVYAGSRYFTEPAPLGVPLPPVRNTFTILPRDQIQDTSWNKRTTVSAFLEFMAPQPDGMPPLRWPYESTIGDFTIWHPHGTELTNMGDVDANGVITEGWAVVHYDWPLKEFIYQYAPRKTGERVTEFVARYEHELTANGATLIGNHDTLDLPAYQFQHFEYQEAQPVDGQTISHYIYIGPFGRRAIVLNFTCLADQHEAARPLIAKIMASFTPGWELKKLMLKEDLNYGELARSALAGQDVNLPAAK